MKTHGFSAGKGGARQADALVIGADGLPNADVLAAYRAWFEGLSARDAVQRYLGLAKASGQSSRAILGAVRRALARAAHERRRDDLAEVIEGIQRDRQRPSSATAARIGSAIQQIAISTVATPSLGDDVSYWFDRRTANALRAQRIGTLADLTVRVPRRKMWWRSIDGLGRVGARKIEGFFAAHPGLTERARALVPQPAPGGIVPWESIRAPRALDGSSGTFRAPLATCALTASNDHEAVTAWLERHESPATQRAYRKEAERLILWAIIERDKPMSSLAAEDATAYRAFLRRPSPHMRWVGPARPRSSPEWRPFAGGLSPRSVAFSLSVLNALFRWLIEQRYALVNPFAGLKVRGAAQAGQFDAGRSFGEAEWRLVRTVADGLEWSYGWHESAAQRLRFMLDFSFATGLRASEFVGARLGDLEIDGRGDHWLTLRGKGDKPGRVAIPALAREALDRYLTQRGLPTTRSMWDPAIALVGRVDPEDPEAISVTRLWAVTRKFFLTVASVLQKVNPALASKLMRASPHWMRHTHATQALERGAELTTVRDNLRHASIATTSTYLHGDDSKRARQMDGAFPASGTR